MNPQPFTYPEGTIQILIIVDINEDHGVPQDIIDRVFQTARHFFDQPLAAKNMINYKQSPILRGYEPVGEVRTDETKSADLNEAFNCGYEPELDPQNGQSSPADITTESVMQGPNAWPPLLGFKDDVAEYYGAVLSLARRLVKIFARVLGLDAEYFDHVVTYPGAMLRLLKYPAQDPSQPDALGIGAHT